MIKNFKAVYDKVNEVIDHLNDNTGRPYKVYTAILNQTGTDASVPTILENTLGDIIWTRDGVGQYTGTLGSELSITNTWVSNNQSLTASTNCYLDNSPPETINIYCETAPLTPGDDILFVYPIEVRVYS